MKKTFVIAAVCMFASIIGANAQEKGKYSLDLNFEPAAIFDASAGSMFSMPYIKARYFVSNDMAYRAGFDLMFSNDEDVTGVTIKTIDKQSKFNLMIAPGFEKHYGTEKLSVYLGAELPIGIGSEKNKSTTGSTTNETKQSNMVLGLNAVIGIDYYVFNNFYIGAELTPGFLYIKQGDTKMNGNVIDPADKKMSFGLSSSSGLRIGFRF
jgi:hypothetical protein